jgi:hypothetical protein
MSEATARSAPPLDEVMLAMDVVDTLRHRQDLALRELDGEARERQLIDKLRDIYHQQGIEVSDQILREGVSALDQSRFTYQTPAPGLGTTLARLYVNRGRWSRQALLVLGVLVALLVGYFGIWAPYQSTQQEQARIELSEGLPAQMNALYNTIFEETKVQQAVVEAEGLRTRGITMAAEGDRAGALDAVQRLTALRDQLRQQYTLRVVNRSGVRSGFWTFPEVNTEATNYYIVVEAIDADNRPLSLPILNEENGQTETVAMWGLRVTQSLYESIAADKQDNGIIENNRIGRKEAGYLQPDYDRPVLGGTVTRW